jgi:hydrogenase nickel incorporation protein HypA/HybF
MHELSIAQSIVKFVLQHPQRGEMQSVKSVKLNVGDLTGIVPESLVFCFELASQGTAAQGSKLMIENAPTVYHCKKCDSDFVGRYITLCLNCGETQIELVSGNELDIVEVELED